MADPHRDDGAEHPAGALYERHLAVGDAVLDIGLLVNTKRELMKRKVFLFSALITGTVFFFGVGGCIQDLLFGIAPLLL